MTDGLEGENSELAKAVGDGETIDPMAENSEERGREHGLRVGTGESVDAGNGTRPEKSTTRFIDTSLGILSYTDFAPYLARKVQEVEEAITSGEFDADYLDIQFILTLHTRICRDLIPQLETLAFAEGRLLSIHPFTDLNGRVTRLFLRFLLRRLDLPDVSLIPDRDSPKGREYLNTLRAADRFDWEPLVNIWRDRFEGGDLG